MSEQLTPKSLNPREQLKKQILETALDRMKHLVSGTQLFEGVLREDFHISGNLLVVKGTDFFTFQGYIAEIQGDDGPIIQPRIYRIEIPERERRNGWARQILQIWEQVFIDAGFHGNFYLDAVQPESHQFWIALGYVNQGFPEGWVKRVE